MNLIDTWLKMDELSDTELNYIHYHNEIEPEGNEEQYEGLIQEYFDRMPYNNLTLKDHTITFERSATTFIKTLFNNHVNNETLVITSDSEHPNVRECVNQCKNTLILSHNTDIKGYKIFKIISEAKKYKKVFVYIIGTQNANGEITPQRFFEVLIDNFKKNNIEYTLVIDDVQGMFLIPRDYSIFDYVIGTAHAIVDGFNMGILISKKGEFGCRAYNWASNYLKAVDVVLNRKQKIFQFKDVLIEYFGKYLKRNTVTLSNEFSAPYIFYMKIPSNIEISDELQLLLHDKYVLFPDKNNGKNSKFVHLRAHQFIQHPEFLQEGLDLVSDILREGLQK